MQSSNGKLLATSTPHSVYKINSQPTVHLQIKAINMQIFGFVLFPVILAVAHAGRGISSARARVNASARDTGRHAGNTTILEMLFQDGDSNANGAWEIEELIGHVEGSIGTNLFEELDTNGDLRITIEELKGFCVELLEAIFKLCDPNGDGFITEVEMLSGDAPIEPNIEILAILFKFLDVNQDGFLSSEDVLLQESSGDPNPLVDFMDVNKDGVIGIQEYNQKHDLFFLPQAPEQLVKLYEITDKNTDDKFTLEEIQDVLRTSLTIMDEDSDGIVTLEEQLHAMIQVGLSQAEAEIIRVKWQMSHSSDMANKFITIMDTDNDKQVSKNEITDILEYPLNSPKLMELGILRQEMSESNANDNFELEPEHRMSGEQAMEALGRFLDNPRFN